MNGMIKGLSFAAAGVKYAFKTQANFRFHSFAALAVCLTGYYFKLDRFEWLWLLAAIGMVMVAELLNTAIEVLVDLVSPDYHIKAGIVKDTAAGAVLVSCIIAAAIGLIIFIPKFL